MKIGVWIPEKYLNSVRIYYEQISSFLKDKDVELVEFSVNDQLPQQVDLYWDPTCTGGKNPNIRFRKRKRPLVATVHGASNFSMPHRYTYHGKKNQLKGYWINFKRKALWNLFRNNIEQIITVSHFAKEEITRELNLNFNKTTPIYHGYDSNLFFPIENRTSDYFFHVSVFQPVKNVEILIEAYQKWKSDDKKPLILLIPGYPNPINVPGVQLINQAVSQAEVARYMQNAHAFFLPSIRESFGLPIIEAMACGTPVIASNNFACEEITSTYGILCDPYRVEDWVKAFETINDSKVWNEHHQKSLVRAKDFSWEKSAEEHYELFKSMI